MKKAPVIHRRGAHFGGIAYWYICQPFADAHTFGHTARWKDTTCRHCLKKHPARREEGA